MRIKCNFWSVTYGVNVRIITECLAARRRAAEDQTLMTTAFDQRSKCQGCPRYNGRGNCMCRQIQKGDKLSNEN
jgi:hypothetical protein